MQFSIIYQDTLFAEGHNSLPAQLAGAVEYTNCISAERKDSPNEHPGYGTEQSDGEALVMWSTLSLLSLSGPFWPRMVAPDRVLSMGQIELFDI